MEPAEFWDGARQHLRRRRHPDGRLGDLSPELLGHSPLFCGLRDQLPQALGPMHPSLIRRQFRRQ